MGKNSFWLKGVSTVIISTSLLWTSINVNAEGIFVNKKVNERYKVTPGIEYHYESYQSAGKTQAVRRLETSLNVPATKVDIYVPDPINRLLTTSVQAQRNNVKNNRVAGAVNASYFSFSSKLPSNLIVKQDSIINVGRISSAKDQPVNKPIAFGVTRDGKAIIDSFNLMLELKHNGKKSVVTSVNTPDRNKNDLLIFTKGHYQSRTGTDQFGQEYIVTNANKNPKSLKIGDVITGTVQEVRSYGIGNTIIPDNGFIISAHGSAVTELSQLKNGDQVTFTISIEDKWRGAEFMIGSGPSLVKNGVVDVEMAESTAFAKYRHPRTAVAVDQTGTKVQLITIDGRSPGYSDGVSLRELGQYSKMIGAYNAMNLDGGGSTAMAVRKTNDLSPVLVNKPSDGNERAIIGSLQVISTEAEGNAKYIYVSRKMGSIVKGSTLPLSLTHALDEGFYPTPIDAKQVKWTVEGGVGYMDGNKFISTAAGTGKVIASYGLARAEVPVHVVDAFAKLEVTPNVLQVTGGQKVQLGAKALDQAGNELIFNPSLVKWSIPEAIGSISSTGVFSSNMLNSQGTIKATYEKLSTTIPVTVSNEPLILSNFNSLENWKSENVKAISQISLSNSSEPSREGKSLKLTYDFRSPSNETKASYISAQKPITLASKPQNIGLWVYGDGNNHWLRGEIADHKGSVHRINFTAEGGLNWTGWKYVSATIPSNLQAPLQLRKIYLAETVAERHGTGQIYIDKLQAIYHPDYTELPFQDVPMKHWAFKEINFLTNRSIIQGYMDGTFKPENTLNRANAAMMLVRELNLNTTNRPDPKLTDIPKNHPYYDVIATVIDEGIFTGKENKIFDPDGKLNRGQMAAILARTYKLEDGWSGEFNDVKKNHWAYQYIEALAANKITTGYNADNTFKPENFVTRAQFSAFMYRKLNN